MAALGTNVKLTAAQSQREALRRMMAEIFGCDRREPRGDLDVFLLAAGGCIGAYYVPDEEALDAPQLLKGAWLELAVPDVEQTRAALLDRGIAELVYDDPEHHYFQAPGGQVFRLTRQKEEIQ